MKNLVLSAAVALAAVGAAAADTISLSPAVIPTGGVYGLYTQGVDSPNIHLSVNPSDGQPYQVHVTLSAVDINGHPAPWSKQVDLIPGQNTPAPPLPNGRPAPAPSANSASTDVAFSCGLGFYKLTAQFSSSLGSETQSTEIGIIPPYVPGIRPNSFFASNTSGLKTGEDLLFLQKIGLKVERAHFYPDVARDGVPATPGAPIQFDFTKHDALWSETKAHDTWALPIIGYSLPGTMSESAVSLGMYGPPRDNAEFVDAWKQIMAHYSDITTYEFWNEPWIYGWNWAGDGATYRKLQIDTVTMAKTLNPKLRIIAGNSASFVDDHIAPYPESYKGLLDGTSNHPYTFSTGADSLRAGDQSRYMDFGAQVNRKMGLPYYYLTEGGVQYDTPTPALKQADLDLKAQAPLFQALAPTDRSPEAMAIRVRYNALRKLQRELVADQDDNNNNAFDIVQYYIHAALAGCYQSDAQWQIGYGPGWQRSNVTFAVMTHFLEDRPIVADIWPGNELIWGAVFANPKFVTDAVRALPRAKEIGTRWDVPVPAERAGDATKVAVIWSLTGASNSAIDQNGTLTMDDASGLSAYDCTGRQIAANGGALTVPFGQAPVYITSDSLDVVALRSRIANARIENVTPVNMYAFSLTKPLGEAQNLSVRVENQMNRPVSGVLTLTLAGATPTQSAPFTIPGGKLVDMAIPWPSSVAVSPANQYAIAVAAKTDAGSVHVNQIVSVALFAKRTIASDADWKGIAPVLLDSDTIKPSIDISQYMLNPGMDKPTGTDDHPRIVARVYTAYDTDFVYITAKVAQNQFINQAGLPVVKGRKATKVTLPYKVGYPDGLNHIRLTGDSFQFAFGMRDRVPGWGRQMDDPWAWKGMFYDTDYQYVAFPSADGPQITRIWDADSTRRNGYQAEVVPGEGPVPGARITIERDETNKLTVYNIAIPRTELKLFDPTTNRLRFGFLVNNSEKIADLDWPTASGVFDYWRSQGSFAPSWVQGRPCQTYFGIQ